MKRRLAKIILGVAILIFAALILTRVRRPPPVVPEPAPPGKAPLPEAPQPTPSEPTIGDTDLRLLSSRVYRVQYPKNWYWEASGNQLKFFTEPPDGARLPITVLLPMNEVDGGGAPIPWTEGPSRGGESTFRYETSASLTLCRGNGICVQLNRTAEGSGVISEEFMLTMLFSAEYVSP